MNGILLHKYGQINLYQIYIKSSLKNIIIKRLHYIF